LRHTVTVPRRSIQGVRAARLLRWENASPEVAVLLVREHEVDQFVRVQAASSFDPGRAAARLQAQLHDQRL
jgi:hypothetical protein